MFIGRIPTLEAGPNTAPEGQVKHGPSQLPLMEGQPEPQLPKPEPQLPSLSHGGVFGHTLKPALTQRPPAPQTPKATFVWTCYQAHSACWPHTLCLIPPSLDRTTFLLLQKHLSPSHSDLSVDPSLPPSFTMVWARLKTCR